MICFAKIAGHPGYHFLKDLATSTVQKSLFYTWYNSIKHHYIDETSRKNAKSWWTFNHKVEYLFPKFYYWSKAPRLAIRGPYISAKKKILKRLSSMTVLLNDDNLIIIDIDIKSAHSNITLKLVDQQTVMHDLVNNGNIWKDKIHQIRPLFTSKNIDISNKILKGILKSAVYGLLNAGNPTGPQIID